MGFPSLSQEDPLEKGMATHSRILAWESPRIEDPGRRQSMGLQRVRHHWEHTYTHRGKWKDKTLEDFCNMFSITDKGPITRMDTQKYTN